MEYINVRENKFFCLIVYVNDFVVVKWICILEVVEFM